MHKFLVKDNENTKNPLPRPPPIRMRPLFGNNLLNKNNRIMKLRIQTYNNDIICCNKNGRHATPTLKVQ